MNMAKINFDFIDIDNDSYMEENFKGTISQARKRAIQLAKKFKVKVLAEDSVTGDELIYVDANGKDLPL
jgi:hypothetical protein